MFTSLDKAIAAVIMGALSIATLAFGWTIPGWLSADNIAAALAVLTPVLVYFVPNKAKPATPPAA